MARDTTPAQFTSVVAVVAAVAATALAGLYSWSALGFATGGLLLLAGGIRAPRRGAVTAGAAAIFVGVLLAGLNGTNELLLLLSGTATIVAWDSACTAIGVGEHLGADALTTRLELVKVTATVLVGVVAVVGSYGMYTLVTVEGPVAAVLFFALAVVLIASALR